MGAILAAQAPSAAVRARRAAFARTLTRFGGSAPLLVVAPAVSIQAGAAGATKLFGLAGPLGTLWLRTAFAAAILLVAGRRGICWPARTELRLIAAFAAVLTAMNVCYFEAIDWAPLGIVSTIEFLGPLAVAVAG